jgi:hypothetical protein
VGGPARENNELGGVLLESLGVLVEGLVALVGAAVVDGDTYRGGVLGSEASSLDLGQGETSSGSDASVVPNSLAPDDGSQGLSGAGSDGGSLGLAGESAALLLASLVQPGLYTALPILAEVCVRQNVVVLDCIMDEN